MVVLACWNQPVVIYPGHAQHGCSSWLTVNCGKPPFLLSPEAMPSQMCCRQQLCDIIQVDCTLPSGVYNATLADQTPIVN